MEQPRAENMPKLGGQIQMGNIPDVSQPDVPTIQDVAARKTQQPERSDGTAEPKALKANSTDVWFQPEPMLVSPEDVDLNFDREHPLCHLLVSMKIPTNGSVAKKMFKLWCCFKLHMLQLLVSKMESVNPDSSIYMAYKELYREIAENY